MFDPQFIIIQLCGLLRCSVLSEIQQLLDANLNKIQGPHRSIGKIPQSVQTISKQNVTRS